MRPTYNICKDQHLTYRICTHRLRRSFYIVFTFLVLTREFIDQETMCIHLFCLFYFVYTHIHTYTKECWGKRVGSHSVALVGLKFRRKDCSLAPECWDDKVYTTRPSNSLVFHLSSFSLFTMCQLPKVGRLGIFSQLKFCFWTVKKPTDLSVRHRALWESCWPLHHWDIFVVVFSQ